MNYNETTYWVTLASMPKMWTRRKNQLFVECYQHTPRYSIIDLFENQDIRTELGVTPEEEELFASAYVELANNAFMVEDLLSQGYEIIPIVSPEYPRSLKKNLKHGAPCVLYVKGNKALLNSYSTAIVGSRNADRQSLEFTVNIARKATADGRTVVSGFAKGVDRQALDAALEAHGKSIIVLPQGITTFASGFRQYYRQICQGDVTVISTFHPKAPWSKEFAMARNSIIYGLADDIYAAQSDSKGGTWSGVTEGLRRGKTVYVRIPSEGEKNANMLLIQQGGVGVDMQGNVTVVPEVEMQTATAEAAADDLRKRILELLSGKRMSKEILTALRLDWTDARMKKFLRSLPEIEEERTSGKIFFFKKGYTEPSLFTL